MDSLKSFKEAYCSSFMLLVTFLRLQLESHRKWAIIPAISIRTPVPPRSNWKPMLNGMNTAVSREMKPSTISMDAGLSAIIWVISAMASIISDRANHLHVILSEYQ